MSGRFGMVPRWSVAAAIAASLGFGAAQAMAAPAAMAARSQVCAGAACDLLCKQLDYARGQCVEGVCRCFTQ
jgi:hypothetical protein